MFMCTYKCECICESILASGGQRARWFCTADGGGEGGGCRQSGTGPMPF